MSYERGARRGGDARGLWRVVAPGEKVPAPIPAPRTILTLEQPVRYCAVEDKHFPGTWRVEPVDYRGRGVVYLFHGEMAKYEAAAFAKSKNRRDGFA